MAKEYKIVRNEEMNNVEGGIGNSPSVNNDGIISDIDLVQGIGSFTLRDNQIIDLNVSKLVAGTIESQQITLGVNDTKGDVWIAAGKTDFGDTTNGFILGIDDSDSNLAKFELGGATDSIVMSGGNITISGTLTIGTISSEQLLLNGNFEDWRNGTAVAPNYWLLSNGSVARSTTTKIGRYSAALTRAGTNCALTGNFHEEKGIAYWQGRTVTLSMWVKASAANVTIKIQDSVGTTTSSAHSGGGDWEQLTVTRIIDSGATWARAGGQILSTNQTVYFDGAMLVEGNSQQNYTDKILNYKLPEDSDLLAYWDFDEGSGSVAIDQTTNANNGAITGATYATGVSGTGLDFDGASGSVQITDQAAIQNIWDGGGTMSFWIKPSSDGEGSFGRIFEKGGLNFCYLSSEASGFVRLTFGRTFSGDNYSVNTDVEIPINIWSHIVITYDSTAGNQAVIYMNIINLEVSGTTSTGTITTDVGSDLYVGNRAADDRTFDGIIEEVRIFNRILTYDEIKALYFNPGGITQQGVKQLGGYYRSAGSGAYMSFDPTTGLYIQDDASNPVLQAKVSGANVGDVIMGDTSTNYAQWDKSEGQFIINGDAGSSNMVVKGGVIHGSFVLAIPNDTGGGNAPAIKQVWSGEVTANNDYIYVVWNDSAVGGRCTRFNRTKANAIFRDSADTIARAGLGAGVFSGAYDGTYIYTRDASNNQFVRKDKDLTNESLSNTAATAGHNGAQGGTYDGTYYCYVDGTTNLRRYTFSGTPWDWTLNDTITLSVGITGGLCWNPINSQWYGYDSANNVIRSFNAAGTQQSTLTIYEDVVGIMMLENKLFVCFMQVPEVQSGTTNSIINCVPFDF